MMTAENRGFVVRRIKIDFFVHLALVLYLRLKVAFYGVWGIAEITTKNYES